MATDPRPALSGEHPLLRPRGHAPERFEPAHWQLFRGPHGFCVPRNCQCHHRRSDRRGDGHGGPWATGRTSVWPKRIPVFAGAHAGHG